MGRAWIAFYMGDYLKDTQALTTEQHGAYMLLLMECWQKGSIPLDAAGRAAVARLPLKLWKKISGPVDQFFAADGTNKRATAEITKAEVVSLRRAIAGAEGGRRSGISKAIASGQRSKHEANANQMAKQSTKQKGSICEATHNRSTTTSSFGAPRETSADVFFVIFDTPEWHAWQEFRHRNKQQPLEPVTIVRDGTAYRGARVPSATPPDVADAAVCQMVQASPPSDDASDDIVAMYASEVKARA